MKFLCTIYEFSKLPAADLFSVYETLLKMAVSCFSLRSDQLPQPQPRRNSDHDAAGRTNPQADDRQPALHGKVLSAVLVQCRELGLDALARLLTTQILLETCSMDPGDFHITTLPLLQGLVQHLCENNDDLDKYKLLFLTCLPLYNSRYVGRKPVKIDWSRTRVKCSCTDCRDLNIFLQNSVEVFSHYRISKKRRHHMHIQLDAYTDCTHITKGTGYAETLVVTKQGESLMDMRSRWRKRVEEAKAWIMKLKEMRSSSDSRNILQELLEDEYDDIVELKEMWPDPDAPTHFGASNLAATSAVTAFQTSTQIGRPQVLGQKRKAAVLSPNQD